MSLVSLNVLEKTEDRIDPRHYYPCPGGTEDLEIRLGHTVDFLTGSKV